jgi:hypothetical protein
MAKGNRLYTYLKISENSDVSGLSLSERLRAIWGSWFESSGRAEARDMRNREELARAGLTLQSDLFLFLGKALQPVRAGKATAVTLKIAKEFEPVLDAVLQSQTIEPYYTVSILYRPSPDFDVDYDIKVRLEARKS